jgi:ubiquinone/menaquinone biosynthesis C-methylase UbiE
MGRARAVEGQLARSFDHAAERYERGRPEWPEAAVEALGLAPDAEVLDLAAGTGKLTRLLVGRARRVVAVEPLDGMRTVLERVVPDAEALPGTAESIPLPDDSVDAVVCGEAFHWFDGPRAVAEIARVLRPGGLLAALFNVVAGPTEPRVHGVSRLLRDRGHPHRQYERIESGSWLEPFADAPFRGPSERRFPNAQTATRDEMVDHLASVSWVAGLDEPERDALLRDLRALLPDTTYRRPWETRLVMFEYASI